MLLCCVPVVLTFVLVGVLVVKLQLLSKGALNLPEPVAH